MNPATARRLLHGAHAAATLVLLATGFLIEWPELRGRLVGGYGRELGRIHVWIGWAFAAAPAVALLAAARPLLTDVRARLGPPNPIGWRKLHIVISLAASGLLVVSGIVLWWPSEVRLPLLDACLAIHIGCTWLLAATLPLHLVAARAKIAERIRHPLGSEPPPLFEFADDETDREA
jgi:cytochrome b subunit of formate dehydrogenase